MSSRPTKRQRQDHPRSLLDNESLACVASPYGPIRTPVVCNVTKQIVLDRLDKEICKPFHFTLSRPKNRLKNDKNNVAMEPSGQNVHASSCSSNEEDVSSKAVVLLRQRLKIGTNECTRALLRKESSSPDLVILSRDVHPPTILAHIPNLVAQNKKHIILLLPGRASYELGKTFGAKKVAILVFLPRPKDDDNDVNNEEHARIDSLVEFLKSKIPES